VYKKILMLTLLLICSTSQAALINADINKDNGNVYTADYTLTNNGASAIDAFTLFFEFGLFQNIQVLNAPADWDMFAADPINFGIPASGLVDGLAVATSLSIGDVLSGLKISFEWLGVPNAVSFSQRFEIYDPNTFDILESGENDVVSSSSSVSEPSILCILFASLGLMFLRQRKKGAYSYVAN
tara:strand:+ start:576 stop:1127 length:552 start_codon:yes stop_codon:yes gene_type:complete